MSVEMVRSAYERLDAGDVDGFLGRFADSAKIFIPGTTSISADHEGEAVRDVVTRLVGMGGKLRRKIFEVVQADSGSVFVEMHEYVDRDGAEIGYHAVHVWDVRDGSVAYWWWYVHEYDGFERAWA